MPGLILVGLATAGVLWWRAGHKTTTVNNSQTSTSTAVTKKVPVPEDLSTHMLFVGDVFWGRSVQTKAEKSGQGYSHITSGLKVADRADYNAWIANFECPITTKDVAYQLQVDYLKFNCRPEYLTELAKWFTAVSNANNHTDNNGGTWGLEQTRANLEQAGIQHFGNYDMSVTDDICEVVAMPAVSSVTHTFFDMPVALCGYMYVVDVAPKAKQLAVMQAYAKVMPVIAMPHMGVEYRQTAEDAKVSAYRAMIDNGADMVVGAHPHVIQNSEVYKGKLIAYSVGNFLFDQQRLGRPETLGLGVGVKLTVSDQAAVAVYEKVGPACEKYKDDCLAQLNTLLPQRPAIKASYNFTCFDEAGGVPAQGDDATCQQAYKWGTTTSLTGLDSTW